MKKLLFLGVLVIGQGLGQQSTYYNGLYWDFGTTVPGSCSIPAVFYKSNTSSFYACGSDFQFHLTGSAAVGSVTNVSSANTDIGVATGTTTPVLTLNSGTGANQIVKLNSSSQLPAVSGALLTHMYVSCQPGLGDGLNAMAAGTYLQSACYNDTGGTITLSGIKCFTDNSGTSALNLTNGSNTALLTAPITCTSAFAAGTQSATVTIASMDFLKFIFVADGTSKQTTWVVSETR